jgi:hypothetical protein
MAFEYLVYNFLLHFVSSGHVEAVHARGGRHNLCVCLLLLILLQVGTFFYIKLVNYGHFLLSCRHHILRRLGSKPTCPTAESSGVDSSFISEGTARNLFHSSQVRFIV